MNKVHISRSRLKGIQKIQGEPIEHKIQRILEQKEPIKDGAPIIFTERKDGVISAYNIRTDRWEIACEAMDVVHKSKIAKSESVAGKTETKVVDLSGDELKKVSGV